MTVRRFSSPTSRRAALPISNATRTSRWVIPPRGISGSVYIAVEGTAKLVRDKAAFEKHWTPDLDVWLGEGIDTPGLVLLEVRASRIKVWEKNKERELTL